MQIEQTTGVELKKTWELANQHFIVDQNQLRQKIYHLEHALTEKRASTLPKEGKREGEKKKELSRVKSQSLEGMESAGSTTISVRWVGRAGCLTIVACRMLNFKATPNPFFHQYH